MKSPSCQSISLKSSAVWIDTICIDLSTFFLHKKSHRLPIFGPSLSFKRCKNNKNMVKVVQNSVLFNSIQKRSNQIASLLASTGKPTGLSPNFIMFFLMWVSIIYIFHFLQNATLLSNLFENIPGIAQGVLFAWSHFMPKEVLKSRY